MHNGFKFIIFIHPNVQNVICYGIFQINSFKIKCWVRNIFGACARGTKHIGGLSREVPGVQNIEILECDPDLQFGPANTPPSYKSIATFPTFFARLSFILQTSQYLWYEIEGSTFSGFGPQISLKIKFSPKFTKLCNLTNSRVLIRIWTSFFL